MPEALNDHVQKTVVSTKGIEYSLVLSEKSFHIRILYIEILL
jgi:hypothetical protein